MTIPEAAQLVMQAGAIADRSQVFVLDMGEPVKILSLAENLVRLAGYTPYQDIDIVETGLRPGEKLYEELLMKSEHLIETKNQKIFIEQQEMISHQEMQDKLDRLQDVLKLEDPAEVVRVMHELVPTFKRPEEVNLLVNKESVTV
jgi:FlaA1/EpsC-like NDP-sugar epimerase